MLSNSIYVNPDNPIVTDCDDDDIRLIGGPTSLEGTVEICRNQVWGGVCSYRWHTGDANIVCSQLGYQSSGNLVIIIFGSVTIIYFCLSYRFFCHI